MLKPELLPFDYLKLVSEFKKLDFSNCSRTIKIAVFSDFASQQFVKLLKVLFCKNGIQPDIYETEYNELELQVFNDQSDFYKFNAQFVLIFQSTNFLFSLFAQYAGDRSTFKNEILQKSLMVWNKVQEKTTATILQSNYVLPLQRFYGNYDLRVEDSFLTTVMQINQELRQRASAFPNLHINDVDFIASYFGRQLWFDEKMWVLAKAYCHFDLLPYVAQNTIDMILAKEGKVVKCVILDCDNTLWGGVIGDDSLEGIFIGQLGPGEAFWNFQLFLKQLQRRGILLAVCSKNEFENAVAPFRQHPGMVLKEEDISIFMANWEPKVENIKKIQKTLNIGLDAMVFLDDSVFERNSVRALLPEVIVPDLPEDPADYVKSLSALNCFEVMAASKTDQDRTQLYREQAQRENLKQSFSDINAYLSSLDMMMEIGPFAKENLSRIVQLVQRSNQFNLTTKRYSEDDCARLMQQPDRFYPLSVSLKDKFGDYGLISVAILEKKGSQLWIDSWLMSCRVLSRGVEKAFMNYIVAFAAENKFFEIIGQYIPTEKNTMVKDFYANFGFTLLEDKNGIEFWHLKTESYKVQKVFLRATVIQNLFKGE